MERSYAADESRPRAAVVNEHTHLPAVWWTALAILPFGPGRNPRCKTISTSLPPSQGVARSSQVLPGSNTLESITVALTNPACDQS